MKVDDFILDVLGLPDFGTPEGRALAWFQDMNRQPADYEAALESALSDQRHTSSERDELAALWLAFKAYFAGTMSAAEWAAVKDRCSSTWWIHVLIEPYRQLQENRHALQQHTDQS